MSDRLDNGVRVRHDGQGDPWSNVHREALGKRFYLQDIDAVFGIEVFGANTGDRLFLEYVPDNYQNKANTIREFAFVAMFDRKASEEAAFNESAKVSRAVYLSLCRRLSAEQPIPVRFFLVIGRQRPPWRMIEINIKDGENIGQQVDVDSKSFQGVWRTLGLTNLRNELRKWVDP